MIPDDINDCINNILRLNPALKFNDGRLDFYLSPINVHCNQKDSEGNMVLISSQYTQGNRPLEDPRLLDINSKKSTSPIKEKRVSIDNNNALILQNQTHVIINLKNSSKKFRIFNIRKVNKKDNSLASEGQKTKILNKKRNKNKKPSDPK